MKFTLHSRSLLCCALLSLAAVLPAAAERVALISDASQLSSNTPAYIGTALTDNNIYTLWETPDAVGTSDASNPLGLHYIQVKLNEPLTLADDEDIIVYTQRANSGDTCHPTTMEVLVSFDENGENWETFVDQETASKFSPGIQRPATHVYFTYRGPQTKEYSSRIHTKKQGIRHIRFLVEANNSKTLVAGSENVRRMTMAEFQIFKLGRNDNYSETLIDRFRLVTDYFHDPKTTPHYSKDVDISDEGAMANAKKYYEYEDFTFENTRGILDQRLRGTLDLPEDWCNWQDCWDENGIWKKDKPMLQLNGIEMPKYSFITPEEDKSLAPGQKRQRVHVIEHDVYAIPGDAVCLYPYYRLKDYDIDNEYEENFSHWYDYSTGGHLTDPVTGQRLLDFLIDPSEIYYSEKYGYFAGTYNGTTVNFLSTPSNTYGRAMGIPRVNCETSEFTEINSVEEYLEFVKSVNQNGQWSYISRENIKLNVDLDFADYTFNDPSDIVLGYKAYQDENSHYIYAGIFDGNGHVVKNLVLNFPDNTRIGFIGNLSGTLKNLYFDKSCSFTGKSIVGPVADTFRESWVNGDKPVKIQNVISSAKIKAVGVDDSSKIPYAGGILGRQNTKFSYRDDAWQERSRYEKVIISNCATTSDCTVTYPDVQSEKSHKAAQLVGYSQNLTINDSWSTAQLIPDSDPHFYYNADPKTFNVNCTNSFSSYGADGLATVTEQEWDGTNESEPIAALGSTWIMGAYGYPVNIIGLPTQSLSAMDPSSRSSFPSDHKYGAYATFFYPRSPYYEDGINPGLPREYTIAADYSLSFDYTKSIDYDNRHIIEPEIVYRHLFHVHDGVKFAEEFSGSYEKNKEFTVKHRRVVSAPAGKDFTLRLDAAIPMEGSKVRSIYYYKISDTDYRRVCSVKINTYDEDTYDENGENTPLAGNIFNFGTTNDKFINFTGQGFRQIDGVTYYACGGFGTENNTKKNFYRFLSCGSGSAQAGKTYRVQLLAMDYNDEVIYINDKDGNKKPLIYREFIITFEPTSKAYIATTDELKAAQGDTKSLYDNTSNSSLDNLYGMPKAVINFDEYIPFVKRNLTDYIVKRNNRVGGEYNPGDYWSLKWPMPRDMVEYGFIYNKTHNYNLYRIIQHSNQADWDAAVSGHDNGSGYDKGLFDRHFYDMLDAYNADQKKPEAERDGLEAPQVPNDCGFMFYVNAASDPGVMTRINVGKLCNGANLYFSAWVCEFSSSTSIANLALNLVAIGKDNSRTRLHTFVTGTTTAGKWNYIYYDFAPKFELYNIDAEDIDHYEIELDNNCNSSQGADYAIDDIRIYLVGADVKAEQLNFPCDDKDKVVDMKLSTPFKNLLSLAAIQPETKAEDGKPFDIYYTILDRTKFDEEIMRPEGTMQSAFDASVIKGCYGINGSAAGQDAICGKITANSFFGNLPAYDENVMYKAMGYTLEGSAIDFLAFNCKVQSDELRVGKDYIIAMFTDGLVHEEGWTPEAADFKLGDECSSRCVVTIQGSKKIKIDGVLSAEDASRECCENQTPMVQIDIQGYLKDQDGNKVGDQFDVMKNACFDWYQGPSGDFFSETDATGTLYLWEVLAKFRNEYPSAATADMPVTGEYTEAMRKYLYEATTGVDGKRPLLLLHQRSYIFPPAVLPEDVDEYTMYVTAIPCDNQFNTEDYIICNSPVEVPMHVRRHAPAMKNGLAIEYPEYMDDVPVRIGLKQLRAASAGIDYDAVNVKDLDYTGITLDCPIRYVDSTIEGVEGMTIFNTTGVVNGAETTVYDRSVYLSETNDPEYLKSQARSTGTNVDGEEDEEGMLRIGYVAKLDAETHDDPTVMSKNMANMVFDKKFNFKEGYYYRMKFRYSEKPLDDPDYIPPCMGEQVVTLKVVPEYMMWTAGGESLNWNNDNSWRRVSAEEMYAKTAEEKENLKDHLTDGMGADGAAVNPNVFSYSPAPFTKVILPVTASAPATAASSGTVDVPGTVAVSRGNGSPSSESAAAPEPAPIEDPYLYAPAAEAELAFFTAGGEMAKPWTSDPNDVDTDSPAGVPENKTDLWSTASTFDIQYDMVAFDGNTGSGADSKLAFVGCGPWQAHVCDQINFMPGAGISNQQHLHYNKAWVEIEMDPDRWYTLSSPLMQTLAGDMYMPTDNSRQESLRFEDIVYDPKLNNRFKPAVYQRSWNKATANLYELPSADLGEGKVINVAVANDWGHVYNDVLEGYTTGAGFSIMTDISGVTDKTENQKVLMRLPKADTEWYYYDVEWNGPDNNTTIDGIHGDKTEVPTRENNYKLNPTSGTLKAMAARAEGSTSDLFLVGNPFMTNLDMEKLLEANKDKIESKYWILSDNTCEAAVVGPFVYTNDMDAGASVAPLQGFFVQAKDATTELELVYNEDMMLRSGKGAALLRKPGRTRSAAAAMTLTVMSDTLEISSAVLAIDGTADREYGAEDAALLLDPLFVKAAQVYTVAGNTATVVNVTDNAEGIEIGVFDNSDNSAAEDAPKFIRFTDTDAFADYMLLDVATGESKPVEEGMTVPVDGNISGRYFLTRGSDVEDEIRSIRVARDGNQVTVSTGRGTLSVEVFDSLGRHVASHAAGNPEATDGARISFPLPSGVYLLRVTDGVERRTPKLIIK